MITSMREKIARQLELEDESRALGSARYLIRFLLDTGCRLGEALALDVERIEAPTGELLDRWWVTFPRYSTKNDKPRRLPLAAETAAIMPQALMRAHKGKVFPLRAATAWYMWNGLREDVKKLGHDIDDVTLHTPRHTCLTLLAKRLPIHKVSLWAGHSSIAITMERYAHLQAADLIDCVDALDG